MAQGGGGNLVLSLLVLGGSGVAVWAGLTDPDGGIREGIRRAMTRQPAAKRATGASFTTTLASLSTRRTTAPGPAGRYELGAVKPHVAAAAAEVGGRFGITEVLGWGLRPNPTDHALGLALDFMTTTGDALAAYVQANAARLGVTYVIWDRHIWSVARAAEGWRPYYGASPHTDHVHVSFRATAPKPRGVST